MQIQNHEHPQVRHALFVVRVEGGGSTTRLRDNIYHSPRNPNLQGLCEHGSSKASDGLQYCVIMILYTWVRIKLQASACGTYD